MVGKVLFVVDGSVPAREAAARAHSLLPKAAEVLILEVVPQLPYGWVPWPWPAFPNPGEDLAKASAYVADVGKALAAQGSSANAQVHFSVLSAAEMDQEILKLAETLGSDLICLALGRGSVIASIVRKAFVPVLVTKPSTPATPPAGRRVKVGRVKTVGYLQPALVHCCLLLNALAAWALRHSRPL